MIKGVGSKNPELRLNLGDLFISESDYSQI